MIDRKEIELLIRAKLQGGRDLDSIVKSIEELSTALDKQSAAAKRGEGAYDELKAAVAGLKLVQDELTARRSAIKGLESITTVIEKQEAAVNRARSALDKYGASLDDNRTDAQQEKLQKLTGAYERTQVAVERTRAQYETLNSALQSAGVNTDKAADEIERLDRLILETANRFNAGNGELRDYSKNVNDARIATGKFADEQKKLARLQEGNNADARLGAAQNLERIRKQEQAESDRLAIIETVARAEQAARGRANAQGELAGITESASKQAAALKAQADAVNRLEQAESDRLATLERIGRAEQAARGRANAQGDIASIRDSERFVQAQIQAAAELEKANKVLRKNADETEQTARAYTTLARASTNLQAPLVSIRDAVNAIINPAKEARSTLAGVQEEIRRIAREVSLSGGKVDDFRGTVDALNASQRALSSQAGLIDGFSKQIAALKATRAEFVQARAEVAQYATQVRAGGEAAQQFVKPLADAEARLRRTATALRDQTLAARDSRQSLRDAGIDTNKLADAQKRLTESAKQATQALSALERTDPAKPLKAFGDEGRTTLSLVQRIRGEILALAAAYVGLQGVVSLATGSIRAFTQAQGLASTLSFALGGGARESGIEIAYLREQADRIGVSFEEASKGYAKFAVAAVKSGAPIKEARFIFEAFAEVGRVISLTPTELNGLFNAIGQSFSKGKIQAEELRQQLAERLPGAFAFAQEALKDKFPDLNKALAEGKVGAENLLIIAESVRRAAQGQLSDAIRSLDAEQQRFNNSVLFFKKEIADAGFAQAYTALLKDLTSFFKSADGKAFAQSIGQGFATLVETLRTALALTREYGAEIKLFGSLLLGLAATSVFAKIVSGALAARTAIKSMTVALGLAQKAFLVFGVAIVAYDIGTYLKEKFLAVEIAGIDLVEGLQIAFVLLKTDFQVSMEQLPILAKNAFKEIINAATLFVRGFLKIFAVGAKALGLDGAVGAINTAIDALTFRTQSVITDRTKQLREQAQNDLDSIRRIARDMRVDAVRSRQTFQAVAAVPASGTPAPPVRPGNPADPTGDKEAKKRVSEIEALNKALETLEAKIDRAQTDTLSKQLEAVDIQYEALSRRITKLGGKEALDFQARLEEDVQQLKLQITRKFNDQLLAEQNALLSKIEQAEAAAGRKQKNELSSRLKAITDQYAATEREIQDAIAKVQLNGGDTSVLDEAARRLEAAKLEISVAEQQKSIKEEIILREKAINDLLTARKEKIDQIREAEANNEINSQQAIDQINALITASQPAIAALAAGGRSFADSLRGIIDDSTLDALIAKINAASNSGRRLSLELDVTSKILRDGFLRGLDTGIDAGLDGLEAFVKGTQSVGDAFENLGRTVFGVIKEVIRDLIKATIRAAILRSIVGVTGGKFLGIDITGGTGVKLHEGGVVGRGGGTPTLVNPSWYSNAPRYHSGGIPGLSSDEYAAVLKKNEEVLTDSSPRNILNMRKQASGPGANGVLQVAVHPDALRMTMRDWLEGELARAAARQ